VIKNKSKDPGPEGPALVHPGGVMWVTTNASCVQVSGVSTEVDPQGRSRSICRLSFIGVGR